MVKTLMISVELVRICANTYPSSKRLYSTCRLFPVRTSFTSFFGSHKVYSKSWKLNRFTLFIRVFFEDEVIKTSSLKTMSDRRKLSSKCSHCASESSLAQLQYRKKTSKVKLCQKAGARHCRDLVWMAKH